MSDRTPRRPEDRDDNRPADPRTEKLVSWLDHELTPGEAEAVESEMARDPATRREAQALRKAWDMLDLLPRTEPSADFTDKTLSRLDIPKMPSATNSVTSAIAVPPASPPAPSSPTMPPAGPSRPVWLPVALALVALPFVGGLGWQVREWLIPHAHSAGRVGGGETAKAAPDSQEFLETLSRPTWFGQELPDAAETAAARYTRAHDLYEDWLERLPPAERQKIVEAPTEQEKLTTIRRLRDTDWVESLPKSQRDQYARADAARRRDLMAQWRIEEEDHRGEWEYATRSWKDVPASQLPGLLNNEAFRREVLGFALTLEPRLSPGERETLRAYWPEIDTGPWELFVRRLHNLADRHALWPGTGAAKFDELPKEWKAKLTELEKPPKKLFVPIPEPFRVPPKYPEYPLSVADYAKGKRLVLEGAPGSCRPGEMGAELQKWLDDVHTKLKISEPGRRKLKELDEAEGRWPEFPKKMLEVVREYRLPMPGISSPTWKLPESLTGRPGVRK